MIWQTKRPRTEGVRDILAAAHVGCGREALGGGWGLCHWLRPSLASRPHLCWVFEGVQESNCVDISHPRIVCLPRDLGMASM